jgi:hypothetical protein
MPVTLTYPGVYIEEVSSGVRTITGVATSITAFIGRTVRGPIDEPVTIHSYGDFERMFGGLSIDSPTSFAVRDFYLNGGGQAIIVRVHSSAVKAVISVATDAANVEDDPLVLVAANEGDWANGLTISVDHNTRDTADTNLFNLKVVDPATGTVEKHMNLSVKSESPRYYPLVLEQSSVSLRAQVNAEGEYVVPGTRPAETTDALKSTVTTKGTNGSDIGDAAILGSNSAKTGIFALEKADLFNLLCIPPYTLDTDVTTSVLEAAASYCAQRRAILIVDPPSTWTKKSDAVTGHETLMSPTKNAALYFPRLVQSNPVRENQLETFAACGAVAGVIARTDAQRGVWKAPAGLEASLIGALKLSVPLTDPENGELNVLGVNCLRTFPGAGRVVWGARTRDGADRRASEWKYLPVRRLALFIEESLYRGTQWVVFEPNGDTLWSQIRLNIGAFMHNLFRQGAFFGTSPKEAYFGRQRRRTTSTWGS